MRNYNNALALCSLGGTVAPISYAPGPPTFILSGALHHLLGSVLPHNSANFPAFSQHYVVDCSSVQEATNRIAAWTKGRSSSSEGGLDLTILERLQQAQMMHCENSLVRYYKHAVERVRGTDLTDVRLKLLGADVAKSDKDGAPIAQALSLSTIARADEESQEDYEARLPRITAAFCEAFRTIHAVDFDTRVVELRATERIVSGESHELNESNRERELTRVIDGA